MANHEFGIMQNQPMNKERFDEYEPNKYDCIVRGRYFHFN